MVRNTKTWRPLRAGIAAALATASLAGAALAATGLGASPAGADTPGYTLSCDLNGTPISIPGAVTSGSLPASVAAASTFALGNYGIHITLPGTGIFAAAAGYTVSGTYTTDLNATGAAPTSQTTVFQIPSQTFPNPIPPDGVSLSATTTPGTLTAQSMSGTASVATTAASTLLVNLTPPGSSDVVPVTLNCTEPPTEIATTQVSAPQTTVTSVLPNAGPLAGGTSVTIKGTFLDDASAIDFGGNPGTIVQDSANQVTATAPPGVAGTVDVIVTTPIGTSPTSPADQFTYTDGPIVTGVAPASGPPVGGTTVTITGQQLTGATEVDFGSTPAVSFIVNGDSSITATSPAGTGTVDVTVINVQGTSVISAEDAFTYQSPGYWTAAADGGIFSYGGAGFYGSMGGQPLNQPIVGMAATADGRGYWEVASDGGIFAFGDAGFFGSTGSLVLNKPIVGMAATPDGGGYWLVARDGGIFAFGDAQFFGSTGATATPSPIVDLVAAPSGDGYWEVAANGSIFAFGSARYFGSMGGQPLNKPIVAFAPTATDAGYWEVASDGGIFAFGDATFYGSMGGMPLNAPMVGMATA